MAKIKKAESKQENPAAGQGFKVGDKAYQYVIAKFQIPGIGERTALEAATDDTQYDELGGKTINEYLVQVGSGVISEA